MLMHSFLSALGCGCGCVTLRSLLCLDCVLELEARQYPPSCALSEYLTQHLPRELEDPMMSWAYPVLHSTHSFHGILLYYKFSLRILLENTFLLEKKTKIEIIVSIVTSKHIKKGCHFCLGSNSSGDTSFSATTSHYAHYKRNTGLYLSGIFPID